MSNKKKVYLVCNAHIDPVWQWEWEEGVAATISTFRTAADLCDEFENFIFCHNESAIYKWIEDYEPFLFERIKGLVEKGKWQIMGGWYIQPDCNMPSGESFVRQILLGRTYFDEKFGKRPTTAINFDPFGHTQGLVQILAKSGYNSYVCTRPASSELGMADNEADFDWIGFDGSKVRVRKATSYGSPLGNSIGKIKAEISLYEADDHICILWGVGNHGGGPSRKDIQDINDFIETNGIYDVKHSFFEEFFADTISEKKNVPIYNKDMNQFAVGCYTSIIRIKQKHKQLEAELYSTEKMVSAAWIAGLMEYPYLDILQAAEDLCFIEFHDSLPGSSIQAVEDMCIRMADHALEILSRIKAKAFFLLSSGEDKAPNGEIPILVYNPHPYKIKTQLTCEMMLADQNWNDDEFTAIYVYKDGTLIPCQNEQEAGNLNLDWRKNVAFEAELEPFQITRYNCKTRLEKRKTYETKLNNGMFVFNNDSICVEINSRTGLIDKYAVNGVDYLKRNSFELLVIDDNEDPWGMTVSSFRNLIGRFSLMSDNKSTEFSGVKKGILPALRVVEDGAVRTVVECSLQYGDSSVCQTYKLPKVGTQIEVQSRVYWNEKNKCLKLSVPVSFENNKYIGQTAFGKYEMKKDGSEVVSQRWVAACSENEDKAVSIINDSGYGSDFCDNDGIRLTLLRSASYTGHPIGSRDICPQDRFSPKIDQGERVFRFWLNAGTARNRFETIDREAMSVSEKPFVLSFFPSGLGEKPEQFITLSDDTIVLSALKKAEKSEDLILRMYEPTGKARNTVLTISSMDIQEKIDFNPFEIKTIKISQKGKIDFVDLMEE